MVKFEKNTMQIFRRYLRQEREILWSFSAYFSYPLNISNNNNISFFKLLPSTRRTFHYRLCILIICYFSPLCLFLYSPKPMVSEKSVAYIPLQPRARGSFLHCSWLKKLLLLSSSVVRFPFGPVP